MPCNPSIRMPFAIHWRPLVSTVLLSHEKYKYSSAILLPNTVICWLIYRATRLCNPNDVLHRTQWHNTFTDACHVCLKATIHITLEDARSRLPLIQFPEKLSNSIAYHICRCPIPSASYDMNTNTMNTGPMMPTSPSLHKAPTMEAALECCLCYC